MSELNAAYQVWEAVKPYVPSNEHNDAAVEVVTALIDVMGFEAGDVERSNFNSDKTIRRALSAFIADRDDERASQESDDDEDEDEDDDEDEEH